MSESQFYFPKGSVKTSFSQIFTQNASFTDKLKALNHFYEINVFVIKEQLLDYKCILLDSDKKKCFLVPV